MPGSAPSDEAEDTWPVVAVVYDSAGGCRLYRLDLTRRELDERGDEGLPDSLDVCLWQAERVLQQGVANAREGKR